MVDWHKLTYLVLTCRKTPINQSINQSTPPVDTKPNHVGWLTCSCFILSVVCSKRFISSAMHPGSCLHSGQWNTSSGWVDFKDTLFLALFVFVCCLYITFSICAHVSMFVCVCVCVCVCVWVRVKNIAYVLFAILHLIDGNPNSRNVRSV